MTTNRSQPLSQPLDSTSDRSVRLARRRLRRLTADLERIAGALADLTDGLDDAEGALPRRLAAGADAVRRDLLDDAIDTLRVLVLSTEDGTAKLTVDVAEVEDVLLAGVTS